MRTPRFKKTDLLYYQNLLQTLAPVAVALVLALLIALIDGQAEVSIVGWIGIVLLPLLGIGAAAYLASGYLRKLMRPLAVLARAMRRLQTGDTGVQVQEVSTGEMGELERGFNAMSTRMARINERLNAEVAQSTAELQETLEALEIRNAELDIARKRALDANRLKSDFLTNMSHEMRTPMNGILGFSELLAKSELQSQQAEYLGTIRNSAQSLLSIIDNILDYASLESGQLVLKKTPFSLRDAVEVALALHAPAAYEKGLELVSLVYSDVPDKVIGDRSRLIQILSNLLSNAVKFTAKGDVVLRVMLEGDVETTLNIGFAVSDTGIGIPKREQDKLFAAFAQGSLTNKRVFSGAGLGLSLCRTLSQAMGGDIRVASKPGGGSTFHVSLQLQLSEQSNHQQVQSRGLKLLLADPHSLARIALRNQLTALGYAVDEVESLNPDLPEEVEPYDLVVLGGGASDNDQLRRCLLALRDYGKPTLVLISSCDPALTQRMREAGAGSCVAKPPPREQLEKAILASIGNDGSPAGSFAAPTRPLRGKHCIAADDNPVNLELLTRQLENLGGIVLQAENGQEVVKTCRTRRVDIALLDIHMPVMNGIEAALAVRATAGYENVPLIALTADMAAQNTQEIQRAGFDHHLTKPVTEDELRDCVESLINGSRIRTQVPSPPLTTIEMSQLPVRDHQAALRIAGGSQAIADKLLEGLLTDLSLNLDSIEQAMEQADWDSMWHETHKLHGSAAVCAVPALHACLGKLESAIKLEDHERISQLAEHTREAASLLIAETAASAQIDQ